MKIFSILFLIAGIIAVSGIYFFQKADIPSSYLTGAMDEFFSHPIIPIIETTRGCPFSCSFCADGHASKNKVHRYDPPQAI